SDLRETGCFGPQGAGERARIEGPGARHLGEVPENESSGHLQNPAARTAAQAAVLGDQARDLALLRPEHERGQSAAQIAGGTARSSRDQRGDTSGDVLAAGTA